MELVAVAVGRRTICFPSGEMLTERTLSSWNVVSCSGQPPRAATRQRLNCPEMSVEKSSLRPSGVNASAGWNRRTA